MKKKMLITLTMILIISSFGFSKANTYKKFSKSKITRAIKRDNQQDCLAQARAWIASCVEGGQIPDWVCTKQGNTVYCNCMKDRGEQQPVGCQDTNK